MKRLAHYFWLAVILAWNSPIEASDSTAATRAEAYLSNLAEKNEFSGTVLVARKGVAVFAKGYGLANREHASKNGIDTKYRLASVTKQFTAMCILLLQEENRLNTSNRICSYIDNCPDAWREINIHHLLTHTSGIPDFTDFSDNLQFERVPTTVRETVNRFIQKPLDFPAGTKFRYSNSGYVLLGHIIEKVAGTSYENFVEERIFSRLGMRNSGYDHPADVLPQRASGYSKGGSEIVNCIPFAMDTPHAAGALYSTVGDLLIWDQALHSELLVSSSAIKRMFSPFVGEYDKGWWDTKGQSCYGWFRKVSEKGIKYEHPGSISGFQTDVVRYPEYGVYIAVLSNFEWATADTIAEHLGTLFLGPDK